MVHIIDWAGRKKGERDTTGCSQELSSTLVVFYAARSNWRWLAEIRTGKISLEQYIETIGNVAGFIYSGGGLDAKTLTEHGKETFQKLSDTTYGEFEYGDTPYPEAGRKYRSSNELTSILVHLGLASFREVTSAVQDGTVVTKPTSLALGYCTYAFSRETRSLRRLVECLRQRVAFERLVVKYSCRSKHGLFQLALSWLTALHEIINEMPPLPKSH